jgi:hypothetical protein
MVKRLMLTEVDVIPIPPKESGSRQPFADVDTLRSSDGLKVIISQRRSNGVFTFGVFKTYSRDGAEHQTGFIPENLGDSYKHMVELALERIAEIKASGTHPFPIS